MTCIHGLGSSVVDYVILDIPIYNQIVNFDLLDAHELESNHRTLTPTLNFVMHKISIEEHSNKQRHLFFDKQKSYLSLKGISNALKLVSYHNKNNIEVNYLNFTTTISTSINKFSLEMLRKNKSNTTNPWYDNECKIARKTIRDASNASLKYDKINKYKTLIKREKKRETIYIERKINFCTYLR